jgi:hypothetical protein
MAKSIKKVKIMSNPDLEYGQKFLTLQRAFGHIETIRDPENIRGVISSVEGWHGPENGTDEQKAKLSMAGKNSKQAISDLFDMVAGMANGGIEIHNGETFQRTDRFVTRNRNGDDVTYHTGEASDFKEGFYLNNKHFAKMRR